MNKHCFRLIFSKPLGFLIPVAEIATAQRKSGQQPSLLPIAHRPKPPACSPKRLVLSLLLASLPGWAAAEIVLDRNGGGANIISSASGVPVIEIAAPNGNGLSHNRFGQFDVPQPGVIFNNSLVNGTSQIGGAVLLNPNLKRTAKAILTEVTGNKPSSISGTLEVFGDAADLLIANKPSDTQTEPHRQAQQLFNEATHVVGNVQYNMLASHALSVGAQIALIDDGRTKLRQTKTGTIADDDGDSFHQRNVYMADILKRYQIQDTAGTLGLFGLDHLRTSISNNGTLQPALQELLHIPEARTHLITPMFKDYQLGLEYYPSLTQPKATNASASLTHPFKLKPGLSQQDITSGEGIYQRRKSKSHVIINLAGDKAKPEIADIQVRHPSSHITFQDTRTRLQYDSGMVLDFVPSLPTKVYILRDPAKPSRSTSSVLNVVAQMLNRNKQVLTVKERYITSETNVNIAKDAPPK